ncbi:hypothetical protein [Zavarzinella formosa]|uniref:hypothetical protein n=1 Tax=Zavarzinella formosa TaxID=360055 RepID=UPI0003716251|nr:hypothetical protein [Zavarzinella formosa]
MEFLRHPLYDYSTARDWLSLRPPDWTELEPGPEKHLHDLVQSHKQWLCDLALARIRAVANVSFLADTPYPQEGDFRYIPLADTGYKVYVEYAFAAQPNEPRPDSDYWWVILGCPYPVAPFPTGRREAFVDGLGWYVL